MGVVFPPNHPFVHRVFHEIHHPFWGTPIFGNIQMFHDLCWDIYGNVLFFHGGFGTVDFCMFSGIWYIRPSVCVGSQRIIYEG